MTDSMEQMVEQAKKIQKEMKKAQEDLLTTKVKGDAGAGMMTITMNGRYNALTVNLSPELLKENQSFIEDLIKSAINDAVQKVEDSNKEKMLDLSSGIEIPEELKKAL